MVLSEEKRREIYKQRKRIKPEDLEILEDIYAKNPRPSKVFRDNVARKLNLTSKVVRVWFQNRRSKSKKTYENNFEKENEVFRTVLEDLSSDKAKQILEWNEEDLKAKKNKGETPKIPFVSVMKVKLEKNSKPEVNSNLIAPAAEDGDNSFRNRESEANTPRLSTNPPFSPHITSVTTSSNNNNNNNNTTTTTTSSNNTSSLVSAHPFLQKISSPNSSFSSTTTPAYPTILSSSSFLPPVSSFTQGATGLSNLFSPTSVTLLGEGLQGSLLLSAHQCSEPPSQWEDQQEDYFPMSIVNNNSNTNTNTNNNNNNNSSTNESTTTNNNSNTTTNNNNNNNSNNNDLPFTFRTPSTIQNNNGLSSTLPSISSSFGSPFAPFHTLACPPSIFSSPLSTLPTTLPPLPTFPSNHHPTFGPISSAFTPVSSARFLPSLAALQSTPPSSMIARDDTSDINILRLPFMRIS